MSTQHEPSNVGNTDPALAESLGRGHEQRDVAAKPILIFCIVLVLSIVVIQALVIGMQKLMEHHLAAEEPQKVSSVAQASIADSMTNRAMPAEPRLQPSPFHDRFDREDWAALVKKWDGELTTVGGFDKEPGRAHIPVDRVMQMAVEKGIGSLKPVATTLPSEKAATSPPE